MVIDFLLLLGVPIGLALVIAVVSGKLLKKQPKLVPLPFRAVLAILSPTLSVLIYLWTWQRIDYANHQISGGGDYMGPMTVLVYGAPIFGVTFLVSGFVAAYVFAES